MPQYNLDILTTKVWNTGFNMKLTLINTGTEDINNPFVEIAGSAKMLNLWGGSYTELENGAYRIEFDAIGIAPGEVVEVGFNGEGPPDFAFVQEIAEPDGMQPVIVPDTPEPIDPEEFGPEVAQPDPMVPAPDWTTVVVDTGTSAERLEQMIRDAEMGTVFELESGTYRFDRTITIDRGDVAVVGAGSDDTTIKVPSNLNQEVFAIGDGDRTGKFSLGGNIDEGDTTLALSEAHSFEAGDFVYLSRESTPAFYDSIGDDVWRRTDMPLRASIVEVKSVVGNTLTLERGVHFDFSRSETTVQEIDMIKNVALGGFAIDYGLGPSDPSNFENTLSGYNRDAVIQVEGTSGLTLRDITSDDIPSLGLNVALSTDMAAGGIKMTGAHNKGGGGNGYAVQIRDVFNSSFVNLSDMDMRHSVVFASWRSAVDNLVHVTRTDRDINFHGGRDHGNVVMVDESIRDANSDIIAPTLFVNTEGTHYGSVTDANANEVRFGTVIGTRLNDVVQGYDGGSWLDGQGGSDILTGGSGNDVLVGGAGRDTLIGGAGEDVARYAGNFSDFRIRDLGNGNTEVDDRSGGQALDTVDVEWLSFDDGGLRLSDMSFFDSWRVDDIFEGAGTFAPADGELPAREEPANSDPEQPTSPAPAQPITEASATERDDVDGASPVLYGNHEKNTFVVTQANTTVHGYQDWDVVQSFVDFDMPNDVEKLELVGNDAIDANGSGSSDLILGNDAQNILRGNEGDDRIWARSGHDMVFGGSGDDLLDGGGGDDLLHGGGGVDSLTGGFGADTFRFDNAAYSRPGAPDTINDFVSGEDVIDLTLIDANLGQDGDQAFVWDGNGAGAIWYANDQLLGDIDGNGGADFAIDLLGVNLEEHDLLL